MKVHDLHQAGSSAVTEEELPADVISIVESLSQKHDGYCTKNPKHSAKYQTAQTAQSPMFELAAASLPFQFQFNLLLQVANIIPQGNILVFVNAV